MDMEMLTIDPKRMTSHAFDRNADPEWAALADYLREAAAAGAVVRLTARPETLTSPRMTWPGSGFPLCTPTCSWPCASPATPTSRHSACSWRT
jgi:hypothetical protein